MVDDPMARETTRRSEAEKEEDTVLQRGPEGYEETPVEEIPLSDATGEGRRKPREASGSRSAKSN